MERYVLAGQSVQVEEPLVDEYDPGAHPVHAAEPGEVENQPGKHTEH